MIYITILYLFLYEFGLVYIMVQIVFYIII